MRLRIRSALNSNGGFYPKFNRNSITTARLSAGQIQSIDEYFGDIITVFGHTPTMSYGKEYTGKSSERKLGLMLMSAQPTDKSLLCCALTIYRNFMRIKKQEIHRIGQDENTAEKTCLLSKSFFMSLIYPIVLDIIKTTKRRGTLFVNFLQTIAKISKIFVFAGII